MGPTDNHSEGPGAPPGTQPDQVCGAGITRQTCPLLSFCQPLAGLGCLLTFIAAARAHAGLEVLGVGAGDTEVQLRLQHALPHPLPLVAGGGAAGGPWRPVGVDAGFRGVIWEEYVTGFPWEPVATGTDRLLRQALLGTRKSLLPDQLL